MAVEKDPSEAWNSATEHGEEESRRADRNTNEEKKLLKTAYQQVLNDLRQRVWIDCQELHIRGIGRRSTDSEFESWHRDNLKLLQARQEVALKVYQEKSELLCRLAMFLKSGLDFVVVETDLSATRSNPFRACFVSSVDILVD
jgi:hypothetical protein